MLQIVTLHGDYLYSDELKTRLIDEEIFDQSIVDSAISHWR